MARKCLSIRADYYHHDGYGRMCHSPFVHYPDFCPDVPGNRVVDCWNTKCRLLVSNDRPCVIAARRQKEV